MGAQTGGIIMHESVLEWLGQEFVVLSAEAPAGEDAAKGTRTLFAAFHGVLSRHGLELENSVRSRLYGRDRATRDAGSNVRMEILSGPARCATSSYIAPGRLNPGVDVAMDLIALRPSDGVRKSIRENDPPRTPCRYITCGPLMILSGQTCTDPTLEAQVVGDILPRIGGYLREAGSDWERVAEANCFLHDSESAVDMRALYLKVAPCLPPLFACHRVSGYSAPGKLVEVEITATRRV
jgi:enamine deaminase RidA (YjgF/YER057c/UK114 family)